MASFAGIFTVLIFLFYAAVAGTFVVSAIRKLLWPFLKEKVPGREPLAHHHPVRPADREHSISQP